MIGYVQRAAEWGQAGQQEEDWSRKECERECGSDPNQQECCEEGSGWHRGYAGKLVSDSAIKYHPIHQFNPSLNNINPSLVVLLFYISASILLLLFTIKPVVDLTINPHELSHLSTWVFVGSWTMSDIVSELPFIYFTACPGKLSPSMLDVIYVISIELVSIMWLPFPSSLPLSSQKLSFIPAAIVPFIDTMSFEFSINELSHISISIDQFLDAVAMLQAILYFSLIVKSISI